MKIEIKFRAWDDVLKEIIYPNTRHTPEKAANGILLKHYDNITQFTGLKDKVGIDIYEGDIVQYPNKLCKGDIIFGSYEGGSEDEYVCGTGFYINRENGIPDPLTKNNIPMLTVIGNIFQNPELINK